MFGKKWKQVKASGVVGKAVQGAVQAVTGTQPALPRKPIPPHVWMAGAVILAALIGMRK